MTPTRILLAALLAVAVAVPVDAGAADRKAGDLRLFTREPDCDRATLEPVATRGEGVCIFLAQPAAEAYHHAEQPIYKDYAARRGTHVLDARRALRGTLTLEHLHAPGTVGLLIVDVTLLGRPGGAAQASLAHTSLMTPAHPAEETVLPFEVDLPKDLQAVRVADLVLRVEIRGATAVPTGLASEGKSFIDLPVLRPTRR